MGKKLSNETTIRAFIYARRSSDRQNEESCPQQITVCKEMAERLGYTVIRVFADEAISGKTDKRPEFQKMVRAIEAGKCDAVIAYKSNRISRNMLQALTYENRFEQHGVKLVYAKEEFGDNAAGRFALRNMMNLNQFYSENMSEDIKRCLYAYAEECKVLGGKLPLGYVKGDDGRYALAHDGTVEIVQEIFSLYCSGVKSSAIVQALNARGVKTSKGKRFTIGTIESILKNEKYKGVYNYGSVRIPNGVPRIVDDNTFKKAQDMLKRAHRAPAKSWAQTDYLLTGKLFCGHCGTTMIGDSGRGMNGTIYNYYCCHNKKKNGADACTKKRIRQEVIEDIVIDYTVKHVLKDELIDKIAEQAVKLQNDDKQMQIHQQHIKQLAETRQKIQNIVDAITDGFRTPAMKVQLEELTEEEEALAKMVAEESYEKPTLTKEQIVKWLNGFKGGDTKDPEFRRQVIDIFVNSIYLYDDHLVIAFHTGKRKETLPFDAALEADALSDSSTLATYAPPKSASTFVLADFTYSLFTIHYSLFTLRCIQ